MPLPSQKPTFQFRPPSESARQSAAAQALAAYQRGEDVPPSPVVPVVQAAPAPSETVIEIAPGIELVETPAVSLPGQRWMMQFDRAGVIITPVTPGDMQFIDMLEEFENGRSTPLLSELVPLVQAIADSRRQSFRSLYPFSPIRAYPETGAEGK